MKALKILVAVSGAFCVFILAVLFRETNAGIRHIFGDWSDLISFLVVVWASVMMILGNIGLWFIGTGFKKGIKN